MENIDFVIPWVDGNDREWQSKKREFASKEKVESLESNDFLGDADSESRYRDYGSLKYLLRSIEKFAPWVNHVFLVTDHQRPKWLCEGGKLRIVDHTEIIDRKYLPTFNSNAIELNVHKIADLSEHFVLFNDDFLLTSPVKPSDFFRNGQPVDAAIFYPIFPREDFDRIRLNCTMPINENFDKRKVERKFFFKIFNFKYKKKLINNLFDLPYSKIMGIYDFHIPVAYSKKEFKKVWKKESSLLKETVTHRFRSNTDVSHWLIRYWRLMEGDFTVQSLPFGRYFNMDQVDEWSKALDSKRLKTICINDINDLNDFSDLQNIFNEKLEKKFPNSSSWEA